MAKPLTGARLRWADIARRVVATFVQAFTAMLIGGPLVHLDPAVWQSAAVAGIGALVALAHRTSQRWLTRNPEEN